MSSRFAYFYFVKNEPKKIGGSVGSHVAYWKELELIGYTGAPFADKSGGLITFKAEDLAEAEKIVSDDPFVRGGLIERKWIKEWLVE